MIGIRLDANERTGIGHFARCLPLALEWLKMGQQIVFFCKESDFIRDNLSRYDIKLTIVPDIPLDKEREFMKNAAQACDILLLDSYRLSDDYIDGLNAEGRLLCCMDDDALYTYSCDVVINPHPFAAELPIRFGGKRPKLLLGGQYWILRDEFENAAPIEIRERVERVLILMGGADVNNCMPVVLEKLESVDVDITAVIGPMAVNYGDVIKIADNNPHVTVVENPSSMAALMSECDMAISAGGNTIYELCALGVPTIILPQTQNERVKAQYFIQKGMAESGDDFMKSFCRLFDNSSWRKKMSTKMRGGVSNGGRYRLAFELLTIFDPIF